MTAPSKALAFPNLDQDALEQVLVTERTKASSSGFEILTRSQMSLQAGKDNADKLTAEQNRFRKDIKRLTDNIEALQHVLERMKQNESDVTILLAVQLQANHAMEQAGVQLPPTTDQSSVSGAAPQSSVEG